MAVHQSVACPRGSACSWVTIAVLSGAGAGLVLRFVRPRALGSPRLTLQFALMWTLAGTDRCRCCDARRSLCLDSAIGQYVEFPIHAQPDRFAENLPYMYFSIWHWTPMVNGYSGFNPGSYTALIEATSAFPDARSLDYLGRTGVTHIAVHCRLWEPDACAATVNRLETMPQVRRIVSATVRGPLVYALRNWGNGRTETSESFTTEYEKQRKTIKHRYSVPLGESTLLFSSGTLYISAPPPPASRLI